MDSSAVYEIITLPYLSSSAKHQCPCVHQGLTLLFFFLVGGMPVGGIGSLWEIQFVFIYSTALRTLELSTANQKIIVDTCQEFTVLSFK